MTENNKVLLSQEQREAIHDRAILYIAKISTTPDHGDCCGRVDPGTMRLEKRTVETEDFRIVAAECDKCGKTFILSELGHLEDGFQEELK